MEKTKGELLKEKLSISKKSAFERMSEEEIDEAFKYCEKYKEFLDNGKTERLCIKEAIKMAKENDFRPYNNDEKLKAGDKIYFENRGKAIALCTIGTENIENGVLISAAHIDSPRLDLKQNPLYEDNEMAMLKTHYYGGIKKYHWVSIPLCLYGTCVLSNGETIDISIGNDINEPVFCIPDLLPHLAKDQMKKTAHEAISGEGLNIIVGSMPFKDDKASEKVKLNILNILNEKYGMVEEDFVSAEFEIVPANRARDIGFDKSLIGAYGHDDRVCAYPCLTAMFEVQKPKHTTIAFLADKEETGSNGATGMKSDFLKYIIGDIADNFGVKARDVIRNSKCLSADVNAGFDPNYPEVMEKRNGAFLNYGVVATKYTGGGGKGDTNDATAEFVGFIRNLWNNDNVIWQTGELGKVDQGGGGTVAKFVAELCMDVIDIGVPILGMHSCFEVASKVDIYMTHKGISAFFKA